MNVIFLQVGSRMEKSQIPVRKSLDDLRELQQCMAEVTACDGMLGHYGGSTLQDLRELTKKQAQSFEHKRERELRKIQALLDKGIASGLIVDGSALTTRLRDLLEKPFPEFRLKPNAVKKEICPLPAMRLGLQEVKQTGYNNYFTSSTSTFVIPETPSKPSPLAKFKLRNIK